MWKDTNNIKIQNLKTNQLILIKCVNHILGFTIGKVYILKNTQIFPMHHFLFVNHY
jgi:hypothetical protein